MRLCLVLLMSVFLASCGTTEVVRNENNTYTVSAQYGAMNGSWDRAQSEAKQKASQFCAQSGLQYYFVNEVRAGVVGWSPQSSTINFSCGPKIQELVKVAQDECKSDYLSSELDPIRQKVELYRETENSVPFEIASNQKYPTETERIAIGKWAKLREICVAKISKIVDVDFPGLTPLQVTFNQQLRAYAKQSEGRVGELIVALYQSKLSYGEFASKRYEITRSIASAQRDFRASTLLADRDAQMKAQQIAEQQMQNNLMAWSSYMQSVNARQPQTVNTNVNIRANCTTQRYGNTTSTNCY